MNTTIRQAKESDIPRVKELYAQWVASNITIGLAEAEPGYFEEKLGPFFVVAEDEGSAIGFATGSEHISNGLAVIPKGERYVEIDDLYVIPEYQRMGIGAQLVEEVERAAKSLGVSRFLIYSSSKDIDGTMKFYRNQGYKSWYVQMHKVL